LDINIAIPPQHIFDIQHLHSPALQVQVDELHESHPPVEALFLGGSPPPQAQLGQEQSVCVVVH